MRVTLNRKPITTIEYCINVIIASALLNLWVFAIPIFSTTYIPLPSMYLDYALSLCGALFSSAYLWFKHSKSGVLQYRGVWQQTAINIAKLSVAGLIIGIFLPHVLTFAFGCMNISFFLLFLAPVRKTKNLDSWNIEAWSDSEIMTAFEELEQEANPVLYRNLEKEMLKRDSFGCNSTPDLPIEE